MMYVIYRDSDGAAVSVGSVLADPLPAGLSTFELSPGEAGLLRSGGVTWDAASRTVVPSVASVVEVNEADLRTKLRDFVGTIGDILASRADDVATVNTAIAAQITERDAALADITTFMAARDAAQAVIDDVASTTAQKNAARTDKAIALANLSAARHNVQAARLALDVLRLAKDQINDSAKVARATVAVLRLVIGSDLLESTDNT
jgi:hypothetical protein